MLRLTLLVLMVLGVVPEPGLRGQKMTREGRALMGHLRGLVGMDPDTVRSYLHGRIKAADGTPEFEEYVMRGRRGKSLICSFGKGSPPLVLVAHLDRLALSPGANDDAAGCAVLLRLCEQLGSSKKPPAGAVIVLFADGGKKGNLGVLEFLARRAGQELAGALAVDLAGIGDRILIGRRSVARFRL